MKHQITHHSLLITLLCMIPLAALHTQAQTQQTRQVSIIQDLAPIGLIFGQTLRYTRANLNDPDPGKRDLEALRIQVRLLAPNGDVIARDEAAAVGAGKFQSFNFDRAHLDAPGESETGRLQVRLEVTVLYHTKYPNLVLKQGMLDVFPDAVEVVDNETGVTRLSPGGTDSIWLDVSHPVQTTMVNWPNENETLNVGSGSDCLIGIAPAQTLRFSLSLEPDSPEPIRALVKLHDERGRIIAESTEVVIKPGEFSSIDFDAADLPIAGERGTGRVQTRVTVLLRRLANPHLGPASLEIFDSSGTTTAVRILGFRHEHTRPE